MSRFWKQSVALMVLLVAAGLWCLSPSLAKPPGGGGGGLVNPAWVVNDTATLSTLRLLSFDGLKAQDIVKAKAYRGMYSPVWSPDGQWIAFAQGTGSGMSIRVVRPDGSDNRLVYEFASNDGRNPGSRGIQWVPGEVDRIIYGGNDTDIYVLSTVTPAPPQPLGVTTSSGTGGMTLSRDMDSALGYQGALAYVNTWYTSEVLAGRLIVVRVVDGASGLEVVPSSAVAASSLAAGPEAPAWSNDGLEIAFLNRGGFGNALQVMPVLVTPTGITLDQGNVRTLYDSGQVGLYGPYHGLSNRPTWSPDDSWIAYQAQVGGEADGTKAFDLFRVPSDGGAAVNVTNGAGRATYPDWNPLWTGNP